MTIVCRHKLAQPIEGEQTPREVANAENLIKALVSALDAIFATYTYQVLHQPTTSVSLTVNVEESVIREVIATAGFVIDPRSLEAGK